MHKSSQLVKTFAGYIYCKIFADILVESDYIVLYIMLANRLNGLERIVSLRYFVDISILVKFICFL